MGTPGNNGLRHVGFWEPVSRLAFTLGRLRFIAEFGTEEGSVMNRVSKKKTPQEAVTTVQARHNVACSRAEVQKCSILSVF